MTEETKVIYHIDDEDTPYLVKLPVGPDKVTLGDFKNVLNRPSYKFFFKSMDDDFGVVKEEIIEDECPLPCFNGRVVSWLVSAEGGSVLSDEAGRWDTTVLRAVVKTFWSSIYKFVPFSKELLQQLWHRDSLLFAARRGARPGGGGDTAALLPRGRLGGLGRGGRAGP